MPRTPYSDEEVATRRNAILDAAMELHDDGGVAALSFRNIAARLGFSYATPYRYFASKEALLTALRARVFRWMEGILMDAVERAPDPMRKLEALAGAYVRAGIDKPSRYALMFFRNDELSREPRSLELVAAKRDALDVCTRVVAAAQEAGVLRLSVDPLTAAHLFWASAHGMVSLQVAGQFVMGRSLEALIPEMIATFLAGLERRADQDAVDAPRYRMT
ncbi:TetR/AcrR family transcriptional regulator [Algiphilus sp.]|uniref:TetR/AcrR family transcriptional regulator n=1 Tax=Algiphilus sp. TaxID=1872431 RepID=UPI0025BA2B31|nr:TetR/AcrR family transcriptional regulator [Algiphilus sp.]MCK5771517.1 TetR/AcrR family transcriptional regulator [Algiphilus sp.]